MKKHLSLILVIVSFIGLLACKETQTNNINAKNTTKASSVDETPTIKKLNYSVELQQFNEGTPKDLKLISGLSLAYQEKDQLRFRLTPEQEGYVYLVNESTELMDKEQGLPKYTWVFPLAKVNNYFKATKENKLPSPDLPGLEFNQIKGKEKLWLIWSERKLMGLEMVKISLGRGDEQEIVKGSEIIDPELASSLKNMLEKYDANKNDKVKLTEDKKNRITNLTTSENIMTVAIELEKTK
jgi:hypothetical protein